MVALELPFARAHEYPHAFEGYPKPPPTLDPGPDAAWLKMRVVDAVSRELTSATVSVNRGDFEPDDDPYRSYSLRASGNRLIGDIRLRDIPYHFYTDGRLAVRVPPTGVSVVVRKGYEYRPVELTLLPGKKEIIETEVLLERSIDMAALGWYSGDTHIHLARTGTNDAELLTITSARDIRYAYILSANRAGYDGGGPLETFPQANGLGERTVARAGPYHITSGHEYVGNPYGHLTIALPDRYAEGIGVTRSTRVGPSLAVIADQAHAARGVVGLNHGGRLNSEADRILLEGKVDFFELFQFGSYRNLGLAGWYDFLNIGYRLPIVGACDAPFTRELGSEITYVWSDTPPTPRSFVEAIKEGRSFATSGPMLLLTVAGRKPGEIIRHPAGASESVVVDVRVHSPQHPVRYLEIIANGNVVERRFDERGRSEWALRHVLPVRASTWIAARAYGDAGTDSHANPVYVYVGDALPFSAASARQIMARLDGAIATLPLPDVIARMQALKGELENLIHSRPSALPRPKLSP